jgi:glycosyltransferase involved in cell wall biosynthesis
MSALRRLLVVSPYPPPADGIGSHTRMLADALRNHLHIAIAAPGGGLPVADLGAGVHRVLAPSRRAARLALLAGFDPDALYLQFSIASYGGSLPGLEHLLRRARRADLPVVTAFHEPHRELAALPVLGRTIYRRIAALTDVAVVYGEPARRALEQAAIGAGRVAEIPHGVPLLPAATTAEIDALRTRERLSERVVLALGFIHPDKGADVLAEAARMVLGTLDDVTFVIAGQPRARRGAFRAFGRADARHLAGLRSQTAWAGDRVRFPGFVGDEDLPALLGAATVMALPYRRITQSGIAHLCVAGAVPAVASRLAGLESTLGDGAVYVPPGEPAPLAAALMAVLEDGRSRERQGAVLAARREAWKPAAVAERIVTVLDDLLGTTARQRDPVIAGARR